MDEYFEQWFIQEKILSGKKTPQWQQKGMFGKDAKFSAITGESPKDGSDEGIFNVTQVLDIVCKYLKGVDFQLDRANDGPAAKGANISKDYLSFMQNWMDKNRYDTKKYTINYTISRWLQEHVIPLAIKAKNNREEMEKANGAQNKKIAVNIKNKKNAYVEQKNVLVEANAKVEEFLGILARRNDIQDCKVEDMKGMTDDEKTIKHAICELKNNQSLREELASINNFIAGLNHIEKTSLRENVFGTPGQNNKNSAAIKTFYALVEEISKEIDKWDNNVSIINDISTDLNLHCKEGKTCG